MDANLNTEVELTKHEKLIKVLEMIRKCDEYIAEQSKYTDVPESAGQWTKWLYQSKGAWMEQLRFKMAVRKRLSSYYAKLVFALASNTYTCIAEMQKSMSPIIQS